MAGEIVTREPVAPPAQVNQIAAILEAAIKSGVTADSVAAVKELATLYREEQDRMAARDFAQAFAALQASLPRVQATRAVANKDGTLRYSFAAFEDLMAQVAEHLSRHGFSVSYDTEYSSDGKRLVAKCTLTHVGGHSRTNQFAVRIGGGPPGTNEAQADGAARTYARRLALCDALNIVVERDTDARSEGSAISPSEAENIERRVSALCKTPADRERWNRLAGTDDFSTMGSVKYQVVVAALDKAEAKASTAPCPDTADKWRDGIEDVFMRKGKTPADAVAFFASQAKKYGVSSYLTIPADRRAEIWAAVQERV